MNIPNETPRLYYEASVVISPVSSIKRAGLVKEVSQHGFQLVRTVHTTSEKDRDLIVTSLVARSLKYSDLSLSMEKVISIVRRRELNVTSFRIVEAVRDSNTTITKTIQCDSRLK